MAQTLRQRLALGLYALITAAARPLLVRKLRRRGRQEPLYLHAIDERFGLYSDATDAPSSSWFWVHAVSLGETRAAAALIARLRAMQPDLRLLLTHGTATGREAGAALLRPGDRQVWLPWDARGPVRRFLRHFRPVVGVLMETEVWPVLVDECARAGVPLRLVNARLSDKSLRQAQRLMALSAPAYGGLAAVYAQTGDDAQRLRALGAPVQGVFGNLKFDITPDAALIARGQAWKQALGGRRVVLLASSREGEEQAWLQAWRGGTRSELALLVPRHPQRFDEVAALLQASGLRVARRSAWGDNQPTPDDLQADVWLGDSLGEMPAYYALADIGLLGGSFEPLGGQNLIEAAACGCPMVVGPHTFNFAEATERALALGAARQAGDMASGLAMALGWLHDEVAMASARKAAAALPQQGAGALERTARGLLGIA
ncbi:MAG: 3-deoxy-D-manno-octulosonic acid transferase [Hydrogenophaga sp.]|uniref:3-deoxy-D-manno-octulosonic acid transferase n=1 Tax=Hydrogenophaga sp. TaxID=1904254 RepID=UPI001DC55691|nr:3-deoxy-D-manno-octulosonic acid transferase [Hydrogenophaga sp.]MBX3608520.1 3-deoxy-D-manno-octulosonic acid transferase [Hydrogenophaga sp.]